MGKWFNRKDGKLRWPGLYWLIWRIRHSWYNRKWLSWDECVEIMMGN